MDNAARIYQELIHEEGAVWFVSDEYGFKIMVKAPSVSAKALIKGCAAAFIFGKDNHLSPPVMHSCFRIYDDPVHFLNLSGTHRFIEDHLALKKVMEEEVVQLQIFNELNMCVAFANIRFSSESKNSILALLGEPTTLYCGDFTNLINQSLDCFQFSSGSEQAFDKRTIHVVETKVKLEDMVVMQNLVVGINHREHMIIDKDEGNVFEQQVWAVMQHLFEFQIQRNPQIKSKHGFRELTDVLAYSEYGIFLFEMKGFAVMTVEKEASIERKVLNTQKAIKKGIDQLVGAAKKVQEQVAVYDANGNELQFDKSLCPHCVVLVSELLPFGDWKEVEFHILKAMMDQPMFLNVMDLKEFMHFIGHSKGSKHNLDYFLMERAKGFVEEPGIHRKTTFVLSGSPL